jgi:hypothetical protein
VGVDLDPEPGLADNGDLEHDLQILLEAVGAAEKKAGTALVLFIDELQYVEEEQLAALITALHRAAQRRMPVVLMGAARGSYAAGWAAQSRIPSGCSTSPRSARELGPGPHRSGDIADQLGRKVTSLGPIRNQLIAKGMVWSPNHGDTAFTVPLFDEFMRRIMPGDEWRK